MSSGSSLSFVHVLLFLVFAAVLWFFTSRARKERHGAWSDFAARNDWVFSKTSGSGMEIQGLHAGRQLSVLTESRSRGNGHRYVTVVRLELGEALPPELTLEPEDLGDRFMKLFGVRDEEVGDDELDAALDLRHVTPESRAVLRNPRVREKVLALRDAYKRFSIVGGLLEAEQDGIPDTVAGLDTLVAPAFALSKTLDEAAGLSPEERVRA